MTIREDAKTRIDLFDVTGTRNKLMMLTEHSDVAIRDMQQRAGSNKSAVKRTLQASKHEFAIVEHHAGKTMEVIEL